MSRVLSARYYQKKKQKKKKNEEKIKKQIVEDINFFLKKNKGKNITTNDIKISKAMKTNAS